MEQLIADYTAWVKATPLLAAAIQFAILGTFGEVLSGWLKMRKLRLPFSWAKFPFKVLAWAALGVFTKYGFTGIEGAVDALVAKGLLPALVADTQPWRAIAISVVMQGFFGPQLMIFHRLEDNLIDRKINFAGLSTALWTLVWFWIPAQTLTFLLPANYRIGLAAVWSLVLGLIMGFVSPRVSKPANT